MLRWLWVVFKLRTGSAKVIDSGNEFSKKLSEYKKLQMVSIRELVREIYKIPFCLNIILNFKTYFIKVSIRQQSRLHFNVYWYIRSVT